MCAGSEGCCHAECAVHRTRFKYVLNTLEILVHKIFKNVHKIVHSLNRLLIVYFRTVTTLIYFFFLPFK